MNVLPFETRIRIAASLVEGNSIRSTERIVGCNRNAAMHFAVTAGEACANLHNAMVRDVQAALIECDEIWTFVQKKRRQVRPGDPADVGDQYVYVGMDATGKLIISYRVGKRNVEVTQAFTDDLRARVLGKPQISTDGLVFYRNAIEESFGPDCHFAQIEKSYEVPQSPEAARRYSPGRIIHEEKSIVTGTPDWQKISTSYIERQNLSMRMGMRRFTRLTNGFSKKLRNLEAAVSLYAAHYNLVRVHETLRCTPAMAAGLTDHIWSIGELLDVALRLPPTAPPTKPEPEPIAGGPITGMSATQASRFRSKAA